MPSTVQFVKLPLVGVPNIGVVSEGLVANTTLPLPVVDAELAAVSRPCASTVKLVSVYEPAETAVLSKLIVTVSVADATELSPVPPLIVSVLAFSIV